MKSEGRDAVKHGPRPYFVRAGRVILACLRASQAAASSAVQSLQRVALRGMVERQ
jgi:hypothetical protein